VFLIGNITKTTEIWIIVVVVIVIVVIVAIFILVAVMSTVLIICHYNKVQK